MINNVELSRISRSAIGEHILILHVYRDPLDHPVNEIPDDDPRSVVPRTSTRENHRIASQPSSLFEKSSSNLLTIGDRQ